MTFGNRNVCDLENKNSLLIFAFKIKKSTRVGSISISFTSVSAVLHTESAQRDLAMFAE